jgi:uncharacterized protein (DUF2225 family)
MMRRTQANKEVLQFVLEHGTDKVEHLEIWDYTYDFESLEVSMPMTYARIEKDAKKTIKILKNAGLYEDDKHNENDLKESAFQDVIRQATSALYEMIWG